ncbi:MAG: 3-hydroxyacyl-CoA dehydrogenase NAD-binding domain-containing protein [Alphaproteobacteria bacterium]
MAEVSGIQKVAVLGAGVMGAAIAAHVANAGLPVVLLDIVPKGSEDRNALAQGAIERMLKSKPAPFMRARAAKLITPGNLEDDLGLIADADWICEAVIENLEIKQKLYRELDQHRKAGSIVSSNTSTIPLGALTEGLAESLARDFAITHFFNPPRYMRLLEVTGGAQTRPEVVATLKGFADTQLGKEVVLAKDTPGFIANRIGVLWSYVALSEAMALGLTVEEADAVVGRPMGIPKTGIFGLADLTGIDLAPHVNQSMLSLLPETDPFPRLFDAEGKLAKTVARMISEGLVGRKGKGGFSRLTKVDGKRVKEALDYESFAYRATMKPRLESVAAARKGLRALVEHEDKGGRYAWTVLSRTLSYAAALVPEIADSIVDVDRAMRTGYAWKWGPFEQIDQLGTAWFAERLEAEGLAVPELLKIADGRPLYKEEGGTLHYLRPEGAYAEVPVAEGAWRLADRKRGAEPIASNGSASLWDIGDGVACLEFHAKMNAIDADIVALLAKAAKIDKQGFKALVIGNDGDNFSVGANVGVALFAANAAMWPVIEQAVQGLQAALLALKYAPFPVVGAAAGMALGGGCEVLMHCDRVQAHAESYIGLVEVGVGLVPAGGGVKELVMRWLANPKRPGGPMPALGQAFETISTARVATSAAEARDLLLLRPEDRITMNRDRVLADAKAWALELARDYTPPEPEILHLPGATARVAMDMAVEGFVASGKATAHDRVVAHALAEVISGGECDITEEIGEKQLMALERKAFMALIHKPATLDRIEHMLETGKPLRN